MPRRSQEAALQCEHMLPEVGYRQWTLSAPFALHWALAKEVRLFGAMEKRLARRASAGGGDARTCH